MSETNHPDVPLSHDEVAEILRLCGQVLNNAAFYGFEHRMTRQILDTLKTSFHHLLAHRAMISFCMVDGALLVEGVPVDARNALTSTFVKRLDALGVESFDILQNVSRDELEKLFRTLNTAPDKAKAGAASFSDALEAQGLTKVQATASRFRRVTDDQVVLHKDEVRGEMATAADEPAPGGGATKGLEQIVAFLKTAEVDGDGAATGGAEAGGMGKSGGSEDTPEVEASRLADLILNAAEIAPRQNALAEGESLADIVVGCLRRQVEPLLESPAARTKQGQKNLTKTLMLLEKCMLDRLREQAGPTADLTAIADAIGEIKSDLQVDSMVAEFMKKRKALEGAEGKLGRYLRRVGGTNSEAEEALREKLLEEGLTPEGWRHMRISVTPVADGKGGGSAGGGALDNAELLALLLAELNKTATAVHQAGGGAAQKGRLHKVVGKIGSQMAAVAADANQKLDELASVANQLAAPARTETERHAFIANKKRLFAVLAELTQELFQPLSVVNATNEMLIGGLLGDVSEEQKTMLNLSADSGARLTVLAEKLREICGTPATATPDTDIIASLYQS